MTGVVNTTGARSGDVGTIVGTPSGGKVLQAVNYLNTTRQSGFIQTWTSIVSGAITMTDASNEVFAIMSSNFNNNADGSIGMRLYRGGTVVGGTGTVDALSFGWTNTSAYNTQGLGANTKDTPGAGTHTYYVKICGWNQSVAVWVSGTAANGGSMATGDHRPALSLTLMEVSA